jgi:hypothetical protein
MIYKHFYAELGKLLYAVADVDGMITKAEKEALKRIVREQLVPGEKHNDEFGSDAAWYAEMQFDFMDEEMRDPAEAFESFISFVEDHHTAFSDQLKKTCMEVTATIAKAYHGTNKKEKALLDSLRKKLQQI